MARYSLGPSGCRFPAPLHIAGPMFSVKQIESLRLSIGLAGNHGVMTMSLPLLRYRPDGAQLDRYRFQALPHLATTMSLRMGL
ncbi:MAG: hypothetical protein AAFV80_03890 [Bacteroidota bacterium]